MARLYETILEEFCKRLQQQGFSVARVAALRAVLSSKDKPKPEDVARALSGSEGPNPSATE